MKAVLKTRNGDEIVWCHLSSSDKTAKLRYFGPMYVEPRILDLTKPPEQKRLDELLESSEQFKISEISALTEDTLAFSADQVRIDTDEGVSKWAQIFGRLKELGDISPGGTAGRLQKTRPRIAVASSSGALIPQTRLRRFYETLRFFSDSEVAKGMADYLVGAAGERAEKLQAIVEESVEHFRRYENSKEGFHPRIAPDWFVNYIDNESAFAKSLVARMKPAKDKVFVTTFPDRPALTLRTIDYEISPFRTTGNAAFENGKVSSSGGGGIDLLLQDVDSGIPVVGEIKSSTDRDCLLALIQALTYAVELASENQFRRLKAVYPEFESLDFSRPQCDIMILCPANDDHKLASQAKLLAQMLLSNPQSPTARVVRRIYFFDVELGADRSVSFQGTNCYP